MAHEWPRIASKLVLFTVRLEGPGLQLSRPFEWNGRTWRLIVRHTCGGCVEAHLRLCELHALRMDWARQNALIRSYDEELWSLADNQEARARRLVLSRCLRLAFNERDRLETAADPVVVDRLRFTIASVATPVGWAERLERSFRLWSFPIETRSCEWGCFVAIGGRGTLTVACELGGAHP